MLGWGRGKEKDGKYSIIFEKLKGQKKKMEYLLEMPCSEAIWAIVVFNYPSVKYAPSCYLYRAMICFAFSVGKAGGVNILSKSSRGLSKSSPPPAED